MTPSQLVTLIANDASEVTGAATNYAEGATVSINGKDTKIKLGGFTRLMSAMEMERAQRKNCMLLHAGDAFQGTLYFVH